MSEPGRMIKIDAPEEFAPLGDGEVRLRTRVTGICGSDMPRFTGLIGQFGSHFHADAAPAHEIVGDVVESHCEQFSPGDRVVGSLGMSGALAEYVQVPGSMLIAAPDEFDDVEAVMIQPLATILRAVDLFPPSPHERAAVIGVGPIGLGFCHVLAHRGVAHLEAIDPIERDETARSYGADVFVQATATTWREGVPENERPTLIVEAVGHQQGTIGEAILAAAPHGYIYGFGTPDDTDYVLPYGTLYKKDLTLATGQTTDWQTALHSAVEYLHRYRGDFGEYVSHRIGFADAQHAYELYARPQPGRLKVVIVND